jgi:small-conductance mechanosensitive channel
VAESKIRSTTSEIDAFGTPTIVHFCAVLTLSAILSAPWEELASAGRAIVACGLVGMGYSALVIRRARRQTRYQPVFEDWLWHATLPTLAYTVLFVAALAVGRGVTGALFVIGAMALALLFIGIHNAWDSVTFIAVNRVGGLKDSSQTDSPNRNSAISGSER